MAKSKLTILPVSKYIALDMDEIRGVSGIEPDQYALLVGSQWVTFKNSDAVAVKALVEAYLNIQEPGD